MGSILQPTLENPAAVEHKSLFLLITQPNFLPTRTGDKKIDKLLSGMSEYLRKFLAGATQLDEKARWTTLLRRVFWYLHGESPPIGSPATPLPAG